MSKHTPGPLIVNGNAIEEDKKKGGRAIAYGASHDEAVSDGENDANLRLFAAAPDLLAAAERIANWIEESDGDCGTLARADAVQLRAAIAKARGGA